MISDIRNKGLWDKINPNREHMKCADFFTDMQESDQSKKHPQPPLSKPAVSEIIELTADFSKINKLDSYAALLNSRRSERIFNKEKAMTQSELAFLLWSTQGIQEIRGENYVTLRPVASGGARHAFETYMVIRNVEGLKPGIYHYLPLEHVGEKKVSIEFIKELPDLKDKLVEMVALQKWVAHSQVVFFWTCVAYRAEWRYTFLAHRVALMDVGHIGQNMMLSAVSVGLGSCCVAAYNQEVSDEILGVDGKEEFLVYACAVGAPKKEK